MCRLMRDARPNPSRKAKFSGANGDREILIFLYSADHEQDYQPTQLVHTLLHVMTIHIYELEL